MNLKLDIKIRQLREYSAGDYHSLNRGYQNPAIGMAHAYKSKRIIEYLIKKSNLIKPTVNLFAIDHSSTILSAYLKILCPDFRLITGEKVVDLNDRDKIDHVDIHEHFTYDNRINFFIDDCVNQGRAVKFLSEAINNEDLNVIAISCDPSPYLLKANKTLKVRVFETRHKICLKINHIEEDR